MIVEFTIIVELILVISLGGLIGVEREKSHKPAGIRTHMLVALGAYLFTMASISFMIDPSRIAAGIVTGTGFICAGTIIASGNGVKGITTAASLWTTSAIGILVGINEYYLAVVASMMVLVVLFLDILTKNWLKINRPKK